MLAQYHGHQLRKGRLSEASRMYLITTVTHQRQTMFNDFFMGRIVIKAMHTLQQQGLLSSHAFVIMPNHIHWLLQLHDGHSLPECMRRFKGYSAFKINQARRCRNQPVWQAGFHDHALRKNESVKDTTRYIIAKPLRAGLVKHVADYPLWDAVWL